MQRENGETGDVVDRIGVSGIVPVVELPAVEDAAPLLEALLAGGIATAEITLRTPAAIDAIALLRDSYPDATIGAGTVRRPGASGARSPFQQCGASGLDHLGMERESEIIVAGKHDHLAAIEFYRGPALGLHGVIIRRVFQPHLGRVVVATASNDAFLFFEEE